MSEKLSEFQELLYGYMSSGEDIPIRTIYARLWFTSEGKSVRELQQKIGPLIARINAKLSAQAKLAELEKRDVRLHKIEPGLLKQTYRLNKNAKV